jgi:hypothetical protein
VVYFGQPGLTLPGVNIRAYQDIKDTYVGVADKDARLLAFHYAVFVPFQDFIPNRPNTPYSVTVKQVVDATDIEVNVPASYVPAVEANNYMLFTSGVAQGAARQISQVLVDNQTGNAVYAINVPLNPAPAPGDGVTFLEGSGGLSETAFAPSPDNNSWPGNDLMVAPGALALLEGVPPNLCMEAETLTHELGHTLGLRHGGTDRKANKPGDAYKSIMSYTWELECTPSPLMPNYSQSGDNTFDDYAHMQFNVSDVLFHLTSSLGRARGEGYPDDLQQEDPEMTLLDKTNRDGPLDTIPPTIAIVSPASGGNVPAGGNLVVNITASDNAAVARVSASFDIDGNGAVDAGEAITATLTGPNTYQATFPAVSGALGTRVIRAIAWDTSSNSTLAATNVKVVALNRCDIDRSGDTNVTDVQLIINEALGAAAASDDLNGDGRVNILDVQIVINAALGLPCAAK